MKMMKNQKRAKLVRPRDAKGRWNKGYCPNPNGRPPKKPEKFTDQSDIRIFAETPVEVRTSDGLKFMSRRAALLQKMYEDAMRGKVTNQRFFYNEFARNDERLAGIRLQYEQILKDWVIEDDQFDGRNKKRIPPHILMEIRSLQSILHYYFPAEYPDPTGRNAD